MSKINSTNELPKWFTLNNYAELNKLNNNEFLNQIYLRAQIVKATMSEYFDRNEFLEQFSKHDIGKIWQQISAGSPMINIDVDVDNSLCNQVNDDWLNKFLIDDKSQLSIESSPAICGVSATTALGFSKAIKRLDVMVKRPEWGDIECTPDRFNLADMNILNKGIGTGNFFQTTLAHVTINLDDFTDKEVIAQFSELLPAWRKTLGSEKVKTSLLSKLSSINKMKKYQFIPWLDLTIWSELMGLTIPHRIYTVALFPIGEKGDTEFKQTVLPFILKALNEICRGR
ncbi:MAG: hypothetical protein ACI843_001329 [Psychrobacter glaciei]|jgi:hypothetical protein